MTKLESCPVAGSDFEFVFFLELDASVQDPSVLAMLEEMERSCAEFQFLAKRLRKKPKMRQNSPWTTWPTAPRWKP